MPKRWRDISKRSLRLSQMRREMRKESPLKKLPLLLTLYQNRILKSCPAGPAVNAWSRDRGRRLMTLRTSLSSLPDSRHRRPDSVGQGTSSRLVRQLQPERRSRRPP